MAGFASLAETQFWTGSEYGPHPEAAWIFNFSYGHDQLALKSYDYMPLAVSPGDVGIAAVPEANTWAMLLAGLGMVGVATRRRRG